MPIPTFEEAQIYKSRTIKSQVRAAVQIDYPVFNGSFSDDFSGASLDTTLWYRSLPSWGYITVSGGTIKLGTTIDAIAPPWIQSKHNLAFPLRRDINWEFNARVRFPTVTAFGVFLRICGHSFRDAEAIWALKCNTADGLNVHTPDGFFSDYTMWSTVGGTDWRRYRLAYNHITQMYTASVDQNDDGVYETVYSFPVDGRYADAIVAGNSTAVQGQLGDWTIMEIDSISVTGVAEEVVYPQWAAPFSYDDAVWSYLPSIKGGRVNISKDNVVDAAEIILDNYGLDEYLRPDTLLYTDFYFMNRRGIIEGRAGDGNGNWTEWIIMFNGLFAEKQIRGEAGGRTTVTVPLRDRWRAIADDLEVMASYSDYGTPIPGVGMNMTVAEIIEDMYGVKCNMPASAYNVVATPNNTPRNYNIFGQSAQQSVKRLCDQTALAVYQDPATGQIQVQEWPWGDGVISYVMSTREEVQMVEWTESAFDMVSYQQASFENSNLGGVEFVATWPPHREPFYGKGEKEPMVSLQGGAAHDARPISALMWWRKNRALGSVEVTAIAQLWMEHNLQIAISDDRFVGLSAKDCRIIDGWEYSWGEDGLITTRVQMIYPEPGLFVRRNLMNWT